MVRASRLKLPVAIVVTFILTSLFWVAAFNMTGSGIGTAVPADDTAPPTAEEISNGLGHEPAPVYAGPVGLIIPVSGIGPRQLVDTYNASRGGGSRIHNAIDIMAARGTPVVAAAPGRVEKLHHSQAGGITAYVRSDDGQWVYYYAHLDAYAPGLTEGQRLERGDAIGFVGFTGNANPAGPHLHFGVYRMAQGQRWYQGTPVNPYPMLRR